jgi:hypothetical protein
MVLDSRTASAAKLYCNGRVAVAGDSDLDGATGSWANASDNHSISSTTAGGMLLARVRLDEADMSLAEHQAICGSLWEDLDVPLAPAAAPDPITVPIPNNDFSVWTDPTVPDGWEKIGSHNATNYVEEAPAGMRFVSDSGGVGVGVIGAITKGVRYRVKTFISSFSGSGVRYVLGLDSGDTRFRADAAGWYDMTVVSSTSPSANTNFVIYRAGVTDLVIDSVSVEESGQLINDGSQEMTGIGEWTVAGGATVTKDLSVYYAGAQSIKVARNTGNGYIYQVSTSVGDSYEVAGWARGDGANGVPTIFDGVTNLWVGTNSTTWQSFSFTYTPTIANPPYFQVVGVAPGDAAWYDDVTIMRIANIPDWTQTGGARCYQSSATSAICVPGGEPGYAWTANGIGWPVEPSRVNQVLYSTDVTCSTWTCTGSATASGAVAPDGSATASLLAIAAGANHIEQDMPGAFSPSVDLHLSLWVKCGSLGNKNIHASDSGDGSGDWTIDCTCLGTTDWHYLTETHACVTETVQWASDADGDCGIHFDGDIGAPYAGLVWAPTLTETPGLSVIPTGASAVDTGDIAWLIDNSNGDYWMSTSVVTQVIEGEVGTCFLTGSTLRLSGAAGSECTGIWRELKIQ